MNCLLNTLISFKTLLFQLGSGAFAPLPLNHIKTLLYVLKTFISAENGTHIKTRLKHSRFAALIAIIV